jgi:hypothetical protein
MEIFIETVFSVGSAPRLYNEDLRQTELRIGGSVVKKKLQECGCEEKTLRML